jgi:glutamate dehydrogenase
MPIDQIVACVSTGPASPSEAFIRDFYRNVPNEDLQARPVAALAAAVCSIWDFLQSHRPGRPRIRVIETPGWTKTRSVVEIINDDMPFLVDSVAAALNRLDHAIHLVIHPVIAVERDGDGQLVRLGGDRRESVMQIEVEGRIAGDDAGVATQTVEAVLADVRAAVIDWTAMRNKVERLADTLGDGGVPVAPDEIAEAAAFLTWLSQNNFTFLGYREYLIAADGMRVVPEIGKGILRNDSLLVFDGLRDFAQVSPEVQAFLRSPSLMMISKSNRRSTVHRSAPLDTIALKTFDEAGNVTGQRLIVGLFTSTAYASAPRAIPVLRRKVARCQERAGFAANSHDAKAFQHILDSFPRDELFQIEEDDLFPTALGIMRLQERQRIALFVRRDPFERFVSCLVYVPRDHYGEAVRTRFAQIIAAAFKGEITAEATQLDESSLLARIHFTIATPAGQPPVDVVALEAQLVEAGRVWADRLGEALIRVHGEEAGHAILRRFAEALPAAYMETEDAASAVADIGRVMQIEAGAPVALTLYRASGESGDRLYLKTFHAGDPLALSDVLPILEHFGLRVLNESPYACRPRGGNTRIWIQEFTALLSGGKPLDIASVALRFETAFASIWLGSIESDGFNRLVLAAGLTADQVVVLRAYAKLLRQAGSAFSQAYLADTLARHPDVAALLVRLFETLFDPSAGAGREAEAAAIEARIREHLDAVANLDEDRILRGFLRLITKSLRTSYYQRGTDRRPKPYLAIKLASREIDLLPLPRPLCEIFVYSPRMEGCHLRGGKVARGGIRWSDRREDFRT